MTKGFINILIYIFMPTLFAMLFTTDIESKTFLIFTFIGYILLSIYFIIRYKKELKTYLKKFKKNNLKIILLYELIGFILMIFANLIINYIIIPNGIAPNEDANRVLLENNKIIYSIILCILLPFLEEIAFRLEFKKNIKNKSLFLFISSFVFAFLHILASTKIIEIIHIIPYFILGYTFSLIYQKTDNIFSNIIAHMIHNTISVLIILIFI